MARQIPPAPPMRGKQLRQKREKLHLNQEQYAWVLNASKSEISNLEWKDRTVPSIFTERAYGAERAVQLLKDQLPKPSQKGDWKENPNWGDAPPPFERPAPGVACGCGNPKCNLSPVKVVKAPGDGRLWKAQGGKCRKIVHLNSKGQAVQAPPRYAGDRIPAETCSKCERKRSLESKYRLRVKQIIYKRVCKRQKGDPPNLEHDQPSYYWEKDGTIERMPSEAVDFLETGYSLVFPRPHCEKPGCPRFGEPMWQLQTVRGEIKTFQCKGKPAHYEYRALPGGEIAQLLVGDCYQWMDAQTGEIRESKPKRRGGKARQHLPPPVVECPDHQRQQLPATGNAWLDKRSRKRRYRYGPCPLDRKGHRGWTCCRGEAPRPVTRGAKLRWAVRRGRPRGLEKQTQDRITLAAAFSKLEHTKTKLAPYLYSDKPASALPNTYVFFKRYKQQIKSVKKNLTPSKAKEIVHSAMRSSK